VPSVDAEGVREPTSIYFRLLARRGTFAAFDFTERRRVPAGSSRPNYTISLATCSDFAFCHKAGISQPNFGPLVIVPHELAGALIHVNAADCPTQISAKHDEGKLEFA